MRAWETYYNFEQSFNNYLLKLADTDAMIVEYNFNQVMASQTAEGRPARNIPQMSAYSSYLLCHPFRYLFEAKI